MNKIKVTSYYIEIIADANDAQLCSLLQAVDGIFKMRSRNTYRCSLRKLPEILMHMRGINSADELTGALRSFYTDEMQRRERTALLMQYGPDSISDAGLWAHQQLGVELAQVNKRFNFFYDTRTGKTRMAYKIMQNAIQAGTAKRCLVVCPATIVQSWLSDAKEFPLLKVAAFYKDAATQQQALNTPAHVIIWSSGTFASYIELLEQIHFDICVFDESSKLKSYRSEISKAAVALSLHIPSWYNLSATPAPNGKHEYYTQMQTVDPYCFNPARGKFVSKYFDNTSRSNNYERLVIKPEMDAAFMQTIKEYSIYVDQSVMPTAGKEWHTVSFALPAANQQYYDEMRTEMAVEIGDATLTAEQAAIVRNKLNQIASGFIMDTVAIKDNVLSKKLQLNEEVQQEIYCFDDTNARVATLHTLLDNIGNTPVVIWANYKAEFMAIEKLLGKQARYIRGGSTTAEKEEAIALFKQHKLQYIVAHPLSIGMGINITEAHNAIYYSINDSWEALKQSSERIYGHIAVQPNKCHYWVIQATDTINEVIFKNVFNKRDKSTGVLEHLKGGKQ